MKILRGVHSLSQPLPKAVVTIGNFDGVHLGHQEILTQAIQRAKARGGVSVAYTFRPHPQYALRTDNPPKLLMTYDEKLEALGRLGVDYAVEEPFTREFSSISPEEFFTERLFKGLGAQAIVVGYDFAFGKGREGHLEKLEVLARAAGVELTIVAPCKVDGEIISSSRIRNHLLSGSIPEANALLGRQFFYRGVVVRGEGRGRKIGFPTANLRLEDKLVLPYGVYAGTSLVDGVEYASVTNIGVRPTFQAAAAAGVPATMELALIEVHLLDQTIDLYGRTLEVRFAQRLRDERKFSGIDALKEQIGKDVAETRRLAGS